MPPGRLPEHLGLRWHRTTLDGRIAFSGEAGEEPPACERLGGSVWKSERILAERRRARRDRPT